MADKTVKVTVKVDRETWAQLTEKAVLEGTTLSAQVQKAIELELKRPSELELTCTPAQTPRADAS